MKLYKKGKSHLFCGHWNGSKIEIGLTEKLKIIPGNNQLHHHPYKEYYLIIEGKGAIQVEDRIVSLSKEMLLVVDPYEKHKWHSIDPFVGVKWLIIKEKSLPDSKIIVDMSRSGKFDYWQTIRDLVGSEVIVLPSVAGAITKDNRILLVRHRLLGKWQIPGGILQLNESIQSAIKREIREELGIQLQVDELISVYSEPKWVIEYVNKDRVQQVLFFFRMKGHVSESQIHIQKSEISEWRLCDLADIPDDTIECCKRKVKDLLEYKGRTFLR